MRSKAVIAGTAFMLAVGMAATGHARPPERDGPLVGISLGAFDPIQNEDLTAEARVEYRHDEGLWKFKPFGGFMVNADRAAHVFAGVYLDIFLSDHFVITPSFAPGIYMQGDSKDLGHLVEFRSQFEMGYRADSGYRVTVSLNHISNAGLGDSNPGVESIVVSAIIPLNLVW